MIDPNGKILKKSEYSQPGINGPPSQGSTGLNRSEIFKILLLLVRSEILIFLVVLARVGPGFEILDFSIFSGPVLDFLNLKILSVPGPD